MAASERGPCLGDEEGRDERRTTTSCGRCSATTSSEGPFLKFALVDCHLPVPGFFAQRPKHTPALWRPTSHLVDELRVVALQALLGGSRLGRPQPRRAPRPSRRPGNRSVESRGHMSRGSAITRRLSPCSLLLPFNLAQHRRALLKLSGEARLALELLPVRALHPPTGVPQRQTRRRPKQIVAALLDALPRSLYVISLDVRPGMVRFRGALLRRFLLGDWFFAPRAFASAIDLEALFGAQLRTAGIEPFHELVVGEDCERRVSLSALALPHVGTVQIRSAAAFYLSPERKRPHRHQCGSWSGRSLCTDLKRAGNLCFSRAVSTSFSRHPRASRCAQ